MEGNGVFRGSNGVKRLSRAQIQKIKKNMQKVPDIQRKAHAYHSREISAAQKDFNDALSSIRDIALQKTAKKHKQNHEAEKPTHTTAWRKKIIHFFHFVF